MYGDGIRVEVYVSFLEAVWNQPYGLNFIPWFVIETFSFLHLFSVVLGLYNQSILIVSSFALIISLLVCLFQSQETSLASLSPQLSGKENSGQK